MAWYYVKDDGTAGSPADDAGRATTERTTSFATMGTSAYYPDIEGVLDGTYTTTNIAAGDTVSVSDAHDHTYTGNHSYSFINNSSPMIVQSVDDTAANALKAGATEYTSGKINFDVSGAIAFFYGMDIGTFNIPFGGSTSQIHMRNSTLSTNFSDALVTNADGCYVRLEGCTFNYKWTSSEIEVKSGSLLEIVGGSIDGAGSSPTRFIGANSGLDAGAQLYVWGFDFTNMASSAYLVGSTGNSATADDNMVMRFYNCKVPSDITFVEETLAAHGSQREFEFIGCDDTDAYRYHYVNNLGTVIEDTSTYRTSSDTLEGGTNVSYKISTVGSVRRTNPFVWFLPFSYEDVSEAATDTVTLHVTRNAISTDATFILYAAWSDSTNNTAMNFISTGQHADGSSWIHDHTSAGSLDSESGEWTNGGSQEYSLSVTLTNADADSPLVPVFWLEVTGNTSSSPVWVDSQFEYS